jgi:hypothetical protein
MATVAFPENSTPKPTEKLYPLASLKLDAGTQLRGGLCKKTVANYVETLKEDEDAFPPIEVFETDDGFNVVAEGFHRVAAARAAELSYIRGRGRAGTLRDALRFAAQANAHHGLPRDDETKRRAVQVLLADPEYRDASTRKIAEMAKVSWHFAEKVAQEFFATEESVMTPPTPAPPRVKVAPAPEPEPVSAEQEILTDPPNTSEPESEVDVESVSTVPADEEPEEIKLPPGGLPDYRDPPGTKYGNEVDEVDDEIARCLLFALLEEKQRNQFVAAATHYLAIRDLKRDMVNVSRKNRWQRKPGMPVDPYTAAVDDFLFIRHPKDWVECKGKDGDGCKGRYCKCGGNGFYMK